MAPYYDGDWCFCGLDDFPPLRPASPLALLSHLPNAAAPAGHLIGRRSSAELIDGPCHGALDAAVACPPSAIMNLRDRESYYDMPLFCLPSAAAGDQYFPDQLPPVPTDTATAGLLDDALLLPLGDIDLEAFDNAAATDEHKPPHHHGHAMVAAPAAHHAAVGQEYAAVDDDYAEQKPMVIGIAADSFRPVAANAFEMAMSRHHGEQERKETSQVAAALVLPPPPRPPRGRKSGGHRSSSSAPAAVFGNKSMTRLDHIGFEELRKYFYMPITRAAREMNVGLTVLKKRCRELGIARWPHRKMKSLKSLILNVEEMGNGMNEAAVRQELAALETYCALMEENPAIELTERTKKLRQACFKESYKRRRAAAVSVVDHIFSFGDHQFHQQQLPPPPPTSAGRHGQGSGVFGY